MERYVAMLRIDIDDRDITEWIQDEAGTDIAVKFIADTDKRNKVIVSSGDPRLSCSMTELLRIKPMCISGY